MKNHLIFCCTTYCRDREINELLKTLGGHAIMKQPDKITAGNDRYLFYVNINKNLERIRGLTVDDYRTCEDYHVSEEVKGYLSLHIGR